MSLRGMKGPDQLHQGGGCRESIQNTGCDLHHPYLQGLRDEQECDEESGPGGEHRYKSWGG